jgi:hypothetical protein
MQAWISWWQRDAAWARRLVVAFMIALMIVTTLAVLGTAFLGWNFGLGRADLLTRINTVAAVSAFVLVAATLFVALIAYLAATGQPDLAVRFGAGSLRSKPVLVMDPHGIVMGESWRPARVQVWLLNHSRYSARNPGVKLWLVGLSKWQPPEGWVVIDEGDTGPMVIQWDGGADQLIHGNWERMLPVLDFAGATINFPEHKSRLDLVAYVAADGVKPTNHPSPIRVLYEDEYHAYMTAGLEHGAMQDKWGELTSDSE